MHVRFNNAAVAIDSATPDSATLTPPHKQPRPRALPAPSSVRTQTLWASPALSLRSGKFFGVRLRGDSTEVAVLRPGADQLQWVLAESVLTEYQVSVWLRTSRFSP
ncbi:hypothetical protein [Hydrogenophaga sp.]|uniref:hypothetical protein n=1 Tax=Hydrogenophaga sp. TaxID=1904254 RepID=UPI002717EF22|nr:hypothetical protein [Hydrogenophaga sp.]MDO8905959.1 hypothetical protein [Hydrogenophaga sp.]